MRVLGGTQFRDRSRSKREVVWPRGAVVGGRGAGWWGRWLMGQRRAWGARPESDYAKPQPKILIPLRKRAGTQRLAHQPRVWIDREDLQNKYTTQNRGDLGRRNGVG